MTETSTSVASGWRTPMVVITAGCLIAVVGFGIRSGFGLFQVPMITELGWDRETFGLAMAIQNIMWGVGVPIAGAIADKFGPTRVLIVGALIYLAGVYGMAEAQTTVALHLFGGVLTGLGVAFTAFSIAMAAMARVVGPERRSLALGLGTAAGSFGQVVFSPLGYVLIETYGWHSALLMFAAVSMVIIPLALALPGGNTAKGEAPSDQTLMTALREATSHRGFVLLTIGFFVCGFHVAFITARSLVILGLLLAPKTEWTIYVFAGAMGLLWLSTVPLTMGIVGQVFGLKYVATLFGIVFLSHQLGSFLGIWLGGRLYDTTGSYDVVWWAGVALGIAAAIVHWPIDEKPLARLSEQQA